MILDSGVLISVGFWLAATRRVHSKGVLVGKPEDSLLAIAGTARNGPQPALR